MTKRPDENRAFVKPMVRPVDGGYIAVAVITDTNNTPIAMSEDVTVFKTLEKAQAHSNKYAKRLSKDLLAGYMRYLETGEEP